MPELCDQAISPSFYRLLFVRVTGLASILSIADDVSGAHLQRRVRADINSSSMAISAVQSVKTCGVLVTTSPCALAALMSDIVITTPKLPIILVRCLQPQYVGSKRIGHGGQ